MAAMARSKPKRKASKGAKPQSRAGGKAQRKDYHHGDLRQALITAALALAREVGPDGVSVREAARRAGVSPGAPFRHFPDRTALMTAVAEEAMSRLRTNVENNVPANKSPMLRMTALGRAYLDWVLENPMHFEIISRRTAINFNGSPKLLADHRAIQARMHDIFLEARTDSILRTGNLRTAEIMSRAFVYGLARMHVDGHFPSWGVEPAEVEEMMQDALDLFVGLLSKSSK